MEKWCAMVLALCACGCSNDGLPSIVVATEPLQQAQLVRGFHQLEGTPEHRWRWTAGDFAVRIGRPPRAERRGALLRVEGELPVAARAANPVITLRCTVEGLALTPIRLERAGELLYEREVPPLFDKAPLVECTLDKVMSPRPGAPEQRELGLVATRISLLPR